MAETVKVKKGWLYTRENKQFAPYTLVENVYTRSGKKYDERVREYIASLIPYIVNHETRVAFLEDKTALGVYIKTDKVVKINISFNI